MVYNLSFDKSDLSGWLIGVNDLTNGLYTYFILISIFMFVLIYYVKTEQNVSKGVIVGSLSSAVLSALAAFIGLIAWNISLIPLVVFLLSFAAKQFLD